MFVAELRRRGVLIAAEAEVADPTWGVRGRVDAWVQGADGPLLVEYKTTTRDRLEAWWAAGRVPVRYYAQVLLYLAVTRRPRGLLVVEDDTGRRLDAVVVPNPAWTAWLRERVARARAAVEGVLPPREIGPACLTCDRWFHCFASGAERAQTVGATPTWRPDPPLPGEPAGWRAGFRREDSMPKATIRYAGGMAFDAEAESGHTVRMDAAPEVGGQNTGFRPTELTAISLAGCTAIDVVSILQKMRVAIRRFDVAVETARRETHPRVFTHIVLTYTLDADQCTPEQFRRAVSLSADRYCSVSAMLACTATIDRRLILNGTELEPVPTAQA